MALFGLTKLGYQNTVREHMNVTEHTPQFVFHSGLYRTPDKIQLPPVDGKELPYPSIIPTDQMSAYGPGNRGSYDEYMRQRSKHIRNPKGAYSIAAILGGVGVTKQNTQKAA